MQNEFDLEKHNIKPDKITKPIQLLAVWLIGLIVLVSALITASATVKEPDWLPAFYSISAVAIIPLFLALIFLLQTKFRPEMQEDEYYSKFLNENTKKPEYNASNIIVENVEKRIDEKLATLGLITKEQFTSINKSIIKLSENNPSIHIGDSLVPSFSAKLDSFIRETTTKVCVNAYLKGSQEIISYLHSNNINVDEIFGTEDSPLEVFLISFGGSVDLATLQILLKGLRKFNPQYIRTVSELYGKNSIYIGSYAYKNTFENAEDELFYVAILDDDLIAKIDDSKSIQEAYSIVNTHMKTKV